MPKFAEHTLRPPSKSVIWKNRADSVLRIWDVRCWYRLFAKTGTKNCW
jgi:hypothetical protein